jgi:hypothetical protein
MPAASNRVRSNLTTGLATSVLHDESSQPILLDIQIDSGYGDGADFASNTITPAGSVRRRQRRGQWLNVLTINCVQCHSHPYDPIRQPEYYKSLPFFNTMQDADVPEDTPVSHGGNPTKFFRFWSAN